MTGSATRPLLLVAIGGFAGTLLRDGLTHANSDGGTRLATLLVNIVGAFVLGLLLTTLGRRPASTTLRLLLGTGLLGALTTWSGLAVQTALLLREGAVGTAAVYGLGSIVAGLLAAAVGIELGSRRNTSKPGQTP